MTWDALQREMLAALGHTLYVIGDSPAIRDTGHAVETAPEVSAPARSMLDRTASPNALLRALLRAANLSDDSVPSLRSQLPPLHSLTGNATAKRALWPMLRAMRTLQAAK